MGAAICLWLVYNIVNTKLLAAWMVETRSRVFISTSRIGTILAMWINESMSNMVETTLITSQWCRLLKSVRETTSNVNGSQITQHNSWDVNEWIGVEHFMKSFDRKSMVKTDVEGEKPAIDACRLQGTDDF